MPAAAASTAVLAAEPTTDAVVLAAVPATEADVLTAAPATEAAVPTAVPAAETTLHAGRAGSTLAIRSRTVGGIERVRAISPSNALGWQLTAGTRRTAQNADHGIREFRV